MNQQEQLEAKFREAAADADIEDVPKDDPFPRMILVCIGITVTLLLIIMGCIFVDFVLVRPEQNVRPAPALTNGAAS